MWRRGLDKTSHTIVTKLEKKMIATSTQTKRKAIPLTLHKKFSSQGSFETKKTKTKQEVETIGNMATETPHKLMRSKLKKWPAPNDRHEFFPHQIEGIWTLN